MSLTSQEGARPAAGPEALPPITEPYVLFVIVPIEVDEQGRRWTSINWAKDLALHLDYITDLTLVSPATRKVSANLASLDVPPFDRLKYVDLPHATTKKELLRTTPRLLVQYWRAIGRGRIIHTGFAGWFHPWGWLGVPLAKLRRKFVLVNIENSDWRAAKSQRSWRKRFQGALGEVLTRACTRMSDLRLFSSKAYLKELLHRDRPGLM